METSEFANNAYLHENNNVESRQDSVMDGIEESLDDFSESFILRAIGVEWWHIGQGQPLIVCQVLVHAKLRINVASYPRALCRLEDGQSHHHVQKYRQGAHTETQVMKPHQHDSIQIDFEHQARKSFFSRPRPRHPA